MEIPEDLAALRGHQTVGQLFGHFVKRPVLSMNLEPIAVMRGLIMMNKWDADQNVIRPCLYVRQHRASFNMCHML